MNDSPRIARASAIGAVLIAMVSSVLMLVLPENTVGEAFVVVFVAPVVISVALTVMATLRSWSWGLVAAVGTPLAYVGYAEVWLRTQSPTDGDGLDGLVYLLPAGVALATGVVFLLAALVAWWEKGREPVTSR